LGELALLELHWSRGLGELALLSHRAGGDALLILATESTESTSSAESKSAEALRGEAAAGITEAEATLIAASEASRGSHNTLVLELLHSSWSLQLSTALNADWAWNGSTCGDWAWNGSTCGYISATCGCSSATCGSSGGTADHGATLRTQGVQIGLPQPKGQKIATGFRWLKSPRLF